MCNTGAVVVSSSALPTGAATDAVLQSADSYLGTIATDTLSLDSKTTQGYDAQIASGGSGLQQNLIYGRDASGNLDALQVNASGELKVASSASGASTTNVNDVLAPGAGGTATSTAVDMNGFTNLSFFGSSTNTADPIFAQVSHNNSTWVENTEVFVNFSPSGEFFANVANTGARYFRVQQIDSLSTAFTLTVNSSKK